MREVFGIFKIVIVFMLLFISLIYILVHDGIIIIERPYKQELNLCENSLNECEETITPQCAEVKCNCGSAGIHWIVIGSIFGLCGYGMCFYALYKTNKTKEPKLNKKNK